MHNKRLLGIVLIISGIGMGVFSIWQIAHHDIFSQKSASTITSEVVKLPQEQNPQITLFAMNSIFKYHKPPQTPDNSTRIISDEYVIIATGDVIPARSVNSTMVRKNSFTYPFEKTADFLQSADITAVNLESPLIKNCQVTIEGMVFCGSEKAAEGLVFAGIDVVSLANNHAGDYGLEGIENTKRILEKNHIKVIGVGEAAMLKVRDKTFGFFGFSDIGGKKYRIAQAEGGEVEKQVNFLKQQADFVVVFFHWGTEYTANPTERQKMLAHAAIDAGADLIIGNHPHWVQGAEMYKGKFITYAHGNFIFDQMWSQETREGVIGKYTFDKKDLKSVEFYPIIIENYSQPRFAKEEEAGEVLARMENASLTLMK